MNLIKNPQTAFDNLLLAALPKKDRQRLLSDFEPFDLIFGETLFEAGDKIRYIYFPLSGIVSLFAVEDNSSLKIGLAGNEGVVGLPVFLESETSPNLAVVQGEGAALRMKTKNFLRECRQNDLLSRQIRRYTNYFLAQVSQSVLCNRLHLLESRLACLLTMMQDRMMTDQFRLKQEFISKVLGVRREAVTKAAGNLQKQELISYSRGNLLILNRDNLEKVCCRCYQIVKKEYEKYLL